MSKCLPIMMLIRLEQIVYCIAIFQGRPTYLVHGLSVVILSSFIFFRINVLYNIFFRINVLYNIFEDH